MSSSAPRPRAGSRERPKRATPLLRDALREAAELVARVAAGRSFSVELGRRADGHAPAARPAVLDLCYGTLRGYGRVQAIVAALSRRRRPDPEIEPLLWCSIYAIQSGRYADYTVVDQAVQACARIGRRAPKAYVNAVLRTYLRSRDSLATSLAANPEFRYQHPHWWIERVRVAYPQAWQAILDAGNTHPPMAVRVNRRRATPEAYADRLALAGLPARRVGESGLLLERPVPIDELPGFAAGEASVQDAGAQLAAPYLDLADGQRVLDACAAPGGKCAHILESASVSLTALEIDPARRARIEKNLARLDLRARVVTGDCSRPTDWWDGVPFDRVLADVPCTASGVVRRHPDIKWLRRESDVALFAARQANILDALWRVLARGGKLLYVTCSVFPEENDAVVGAFCARTPGARRLDLPDRAPAQLFPDADHDGFYFALLAKQT
jgi:16S rRNA (cytosine967-C5)-methyltransferase